MENQTAPVEIYQVSEAKSSYGPAVQLLVSRTWLGILVLCGLGLTLVWTSFLGYGLVQLLEHLS